MPVACSASFRITPRSCPLLGILHVRCTVYLYIVHRTYKCTSVHSICTMYIVISSTAGCGCVPASSSQQKTDFDTNICVPEIPLCVYYCTMEDSRGVDITTYVHRTMYIVLCTRYIVLVCTCTMYIVALLVQGTSYILVAASRASRYYCNIHELCYLVAFTTGMCLPVCCT